MNKSIWTDKVNISDFPQLEGEKQTDILIIGGGIAGILTAYFLELKGVDYILVEGGKICSGTTHNTTAKITAQHGLIYSKIYESEGIQTARAYLKANQMALDNYKKLSENIDCDFEIKDNYVYSVSDRKKLEKEIEVLAKLNYNAELTEDISLPLETVGAVKFPKQAQFHPLKFLTKIAENLNIYENTFIEKISGTSATFKNGKINAKKIIMATHFPFINRHGSYFLKLYQHRSYCLALSDSPDYDGMYVDEADTGLSFRNYGNTLILGGGGHKTGKKGGNWAELRTFAKVNYPESTEKYFWAAQDCITLDDRPYIGNYSALTPDFYVATGFNKWGMTSAMIAAMILCDLILGKENEFTKVFSPSRSILKQQLLINSFEAVTNLVNLKTKRCPHLGCALKWNKAEHSWDCPCHGSRFTEDGKVIENPAMKNIRP